MIQIENISKKHNEIEGLKIAIVLSGCGFKDGAEITESVSTLIILGQHNISYQCFAPDIDVTSKNHISDADGETRNILVESARITRGNVLNLDQLNEADFDAIIFPGGFGAALHLSSWATKGSQSEVIPAITKNIKDFYEASKPIGAICISPTLVANVLGKEGVTVTIGNDSVTAAEIEKTGSKHENCPVTDCVTDRVHKVITTPAYMYDEAKPSEVFQGISVLIKELLEMA